MRDYTSTKYSMLMYVSCFGTSDMFRSPGWREEFDLDGILHKNIFANLDVLG